jgi:hypothetical protein
MPDDLYVTAHDRVAAAAKAQIDIIQFAESVPPPPCRLEESIGVEMGGRAKHVQRCIAQNVTNSRVNVDVFPMHTHLGRLVG